MLITSPSSKIIPRVASVKNVPEPVAVVALFAHVSVAKVTPFFCNVTVPPVVGAVFAIPVITPQTAKRSTVLLMVAAVKSSAETSKIPCGHLFWFSWSCPIKKHQKVPLCLGNKKAHFRELVCLTAL